LILFPKLKPTLKGRRFQTIEEIKGKCDKRTAQCHTKCVPGSIATMEETLETVYGQYMGLLWRRQCLQCCKISNKVFMAKVLSFFEHALFFAIYYLLLSNFYEDKMYYLSTRCLQNLHLFISSSVWRKSDYLQDKFGSQRI
jgi:hypothetical protein